MCTRTWRGYTSQAKCEHSNPSAVHLARNSSNSGSRAIFRIFCGSHRRSVCNDPLKVQTLLSNGCWCIASLSCLECDGLRGGVPSYFQTKIKECIGIDHPLNRLRSPSHGVVIGNILGIYLSRSNHFYWPSLHKFRRRFPSSGWNHDTKDPSSVLNSLVIAPMAET